MSLKPPKSTLRLKPSGLLGGEQIAPLTGIFMVMIGLFACNYFLLLFPEFKVSVITMDIFLVAVGTYLIIKTNRQIRKNLLTPLTQMRDWAYAIQDGDLTARLPLPDQGEFLKLAIVINDLGDSIYSLNQEMDEKVKQQTHRLEQKTKMLEILYEVAATSNSSHNIEDLLQNYLFTLFNLVKASAATARVVTDDNKLKIISTIGVDSISSDEKMVGIERCLCAQDYSTPVIKCGTGRNMCGNLLPNSLTLNERAPVIVIPLQYQNRTLGIYHLFDPEINIEEEAELKNILTNISQHLSLAMETRRLDNQSKRLHIMQERTMLAHELHDSLAQTLASLRFQVSLLEKTLAPSNESRAKLEVGQLKSGLDEANTELRELLAHFRVHMDERGLIPATETLIERFQNESGINVYFQNQSSELTLPPIQEVQILHIIQESLTNARKHSQAKNVRVLIRESNNQNCQVLIEDDGVGFIDPNVKGLPGEHVGLSIMQERARRINGEVSIESDAGEGTRVELNFPISRASTKSEDYLENIEKN